MSTTFAITDENDFALDAVGGLVLRTGQQAMADICKNAMQDQLGEMVYRMANGMPTLQTVWDRYSPVKFEAAGRVTLSAVPGVLSVDSFTVAQLGNVLTYAATIRTIHGNIQLNG